MQTCGNSRKIRVCIPLNSPLKRGGALREQEIGSVILNEVKDLDPIRERFRDSSALRFQNDKHDVIMID